MFGPEKILVWERAVDFADLVYALTEAWPASDSAGVGQSLRHAAVGLCCSLAVAALPQSPRAMRRLITQACTRLEEIPLLATLAWRRGWIQKDSLDSLLITSTFEREALHQLLRSNS